MNIQVQACGAAILLLLLYLIKRQRSVGLFSEKVFFAMLLVTLYNISLDILSVALLVWRQRFPQWFVWFICKSYLVSLAMVTFMGLIYAVLDIYGEKKHRHFISRCLPFLVLGAALIYALPIACRVEGNWTYTYGPSVLITYVFALGYVICTLYQMAVYGKRINPRRKRAVLTWMLIWVGAAVVQFFNNELLLVGFAMALGMVILFFELENPEARIDRETGAFNSHALLDYMKLCYRSEKTFSILTISLDNYQGNAEETEDVNAALKDIVQYLENATDAKIFKNVERELILIFSDEKELYAALPRIQERFSGVWNAAGDRAIQLEPLYMLLPDSAIANSAEEVFYLFQFYKYESHRHSEGDAVCTIDRFVAQERREKKEMEDMVRAAIDDDRVEVFYQPIYSTKQRKFVSAEALVRIRDKDGNIVPPGRFIEVAEETGLITKLGEIVFEKTCRFMKMQKIWELGIEYIEVNLSVRQCEKKDLARIYMDIIRKYDLNPACINLEITETASIRTKQILVENMQVLIDFGVHFSLDDFGSGESNLNYIVDMPVSIVKFDRDMSQAYFENKKAKFVMEAAMRMIHEMKLKIVSEGVETKEQMETIVAMGIDYIQGYYFSKPLPQAEFLDFIRRENMGRGNA